MGGGSDGGLKGGKVAARWKRGCGQLPPKKYHPVGTVPDELLSRVLGRIVLGGKPSNLIAQKQPDHHRQQGASFPHIGQERATGGDSVVFPQLPNQHDGWGHLKRNVFVLHDTEREQKKLRVEAGQLVAPSHWTLALGIGLEKVSDQHVPAGLQQLGGGGQRRGYGDLPETLT